MFVHLHCHSGYSFLEGAATIPGLLEGAKRLGMKALALTDRNGGYGLVEFYKLAARMGIKPILGAELDDGSGQRAVVLARDREGYAELCRLITERRLNQRFSLIEALKETSEGIIILSSSLTLLQELFPYRREDLFAELVITRKAKSRAQAQGIYNLATGLSIPLVATNDVHFVSPRDHIIHRLLRAIGERKTIASVGNLVSPDCYLKSDPQMRELFRNLPQALKNTERIAEACQVDLKLGEWKYPSFPLPPGEDPHRYLSWLAWQGLRRRYHPPSPEAQERLKYELKVIGGLNLSPYFLLVWDIVQEAKRRGIGFVGRGSAADSLVSYCLELTDVCPLKHNLYFERFLNPQRDSPPDIDLDFSWKQRDGMLEYVYAKYGRERVAMISTFSRLKPRAAFREVAKAFGLSEEEIGPFTSRIPSWGEEKLSRLREKIPECRNLPWESEPFRRIAGLAERIIGFPRHLSIHCGGIVICPSTLTDYLPLERAPKGLVITQYDMFSVEDMGLLKIDLLSQRSLAVLTDTVEEVSKQEGRRPPVDDLEVVFRDEKTCRLIREGKTMGCFYIESPGMRQLLQKLRVESFEGLTAASSIIRPGVAESGMMAEYISRHHNREKITYLHPKLQELLGESYGVMVYQEDVLKVAHNLGGMSLGEADLLRRAMSGKLRSPEAMKKVKGRFLQSCGHQGLDPEVARKIWQQMESFAGYAFCKAHSASFAQLSFRVAYLKAHYPAQFMAAVLSNGGGFYSPGAYIQEAKRMGLNVLLPDVNHSQIYYTGSGNQIRIGLGAIKRLSQRSTDSLLEARENGSFSTLTDLIKRTTLCLAELETLIKCGALDAFGSTRPELLWELSLFFPRIRGGGSPPWGIRERLPHLPQYPLVKRCLIELETFGYMVSAHPLELLKVNPPGLTSACGLGEKVNQKVSMIGWVISSKRITTKKGEPMRYLSMEDTTGDFEVVLFPNRYRLYAPITLGPGPYLVEGRVKEDWGTLTVIAQRIRRLGYSNQPRRLNGQVF